MRRLWGIRHIRWFLACWALSRHVERMRACGLGIVANQSDIDHLDAIWRGER